MKGFFVDPFAILADETIGHDTRLELYKVIEEQFRALQDRVAYLEQKIRRRRTRMKRRRRRREQTENDEEDEEDDESG